MEFQDNILEKSNNYSQKPYQIDHCSDLTKLYRDQMVLGREVS